MKSFLPIALRLLLVGSLGGLGYLYFAKPQNLPGPLQNAVDLSINQIGKVLAVVDQTGIPNQAANLLTKPQPIVEDTPQIAQVQGVNTSQVTQQAQQVINQTVSQVSEQLQSLPKKEAAKILRQTCEQIAADLEK